jgi:hypothetical protein
MPWGNWFLGFIWVLGTLWVVYEIAEDLFEFKDHKQLYQWSILLLCVILGFIFLYKGRIRSIIFDKNSGTLTIKKRNIFCDNRSITTYHLKDITDVRAVQRGYKINSIDTEMYYVIIEFENNADLNQDTDEADSSFSSSDEELEFKKN